MRAIVAGLVTAATMAAQGPGDARLLWDEALLRKRPPAAAAKPRTDINYRPISAATAPSSGPGVSILGVTLWRLRPSRAEDDKDARLLVLVDPQRPKQAMTPERIAVDAPLASGDRVRLSVEAPQAGYLYVVDRELSAGGKLGRPALIYPNFQTRAGDNAVAPGRTIEIPDQRDRIDHFEIRPTSPDYAGEMLLLIITQQPLADLKTDANPNYLPEETVARWERDYAVQAERFELEGGAGKSWTAAEKSAGADHSKALTQGDSMPQTIYRVRHRPGEPVLVRLPLRIGK